MLLRRVAAALGTLAAMSLAGCSAVILSTGTPEGEIIAYGATVATLTERLGQPVSVRALPGPIDTYDLRRKESALNIFSELRPKRLPDGSVKYPEAVETRDFIFRGTLKKEHDVGEAMGTGLMTLGLMEVLNFPAAVAQRSERDHRLVVWFDVEGRALAYRWQLESK